MRLRCPGNLTPETHLAREFGAGRRVVGACRRIVGRQAVARSVALDIEPVGPEVTLERLVGLAVDEGDQSPA